MQFANIIYARSHSLGGILIRNHEAFGRWSHCGLMTPDNTVLESRAFHGVTETPHREFVGRYPFSCIVSIDCPRPELAIGWFRDQLGKGYDYLAILGLLARRSWQEDDRWHCCEAVEMALTVGGHQRFRDSPWRISPNASYMVI
jgi:hypothetical protein